MLTALGALITIPFFPVPLTLQLLFAVMAGLVLGPRYGFISQLVYISLGLIGLPVFSGGLGGLGIIFAPSFGYILGFPFAALLTGYLSVKTRRPNFIKLYGITLTGLAVIYIPGVLYLYLALNHFLGKATTFQAALQTGTIPFILPDLLKCLLAAWLGLEYRKRIFPYFSKASVFDSNPPAEESSNISLKLRK